MRFCTQVFLRLFDQFRIAMLIPVFSDFAEDTEEESRKKKHILAAKTR